MTATSGRERGTGFRPVGLEGNGPITARRRSVNRVSSAATRGKHGSVRVILSQFASVRPAAKERWERSRRVVMFRAAVYVYRI